MDTEKVTQILLNVVDSLNRQLSPDQRLERSTATVLVGEGGRLDSLGLINFIVAVEQKIEDEFHVTLTLTDTLLSSDDGSFRTVGNLADYITAKLGEQ